MKNIVLVLFFLVFSTVRYGYAQTLTPTTWKAYGLTFNAPSGMAVEDDSDEGYIISNDNYYISVQILDSEGMTQGEMPQELKNIASDDGVTEASEVDKFDLHHFYGVKLEGKCESDNCVYSYLLAKDGGNAFFISIIVRQASGSIMDAILKSFKLEEE